MKQSKILIIAYAALSLSFQFSAFSEVSIVKNDDGGVKVSTGRYSVKFGLEGAMQSLEVAGVEFLKAPEWYQAGGMFAVDYVPPGQTGIVSDKVRAAVISRIEIEKNKVTVSGGSMTLEYDFRESGFDISGQSKSDRKFLMFFPSDNVVQSLDSLTDRAVMMNEGQVVAMQQEGMRWSSKQGPMLRFDERMDGYAKFYWWSDKYGGSKRAVSAQVRSRKGALFSIEALPKPGPEEAIAFSIKAESVDFLLPGGKPASFKVEAHNLSANTHETQVDFEVRDYLTRKVVAGSKTKLNLKAGEKATVNATANLTSPGPYRGALLVRNGDKLVRDMEWVFTYDFPAYKAETTRPDDFKEFWAKALAELKQVPLKPEMKLNKEKSTATIDVFEVRLEGLGKKHFWGWYSRPKKEGKYPGYFICPPTGLFQPGGPARMEGVCTFYIAIHGFDLHLSDVPEGPHPWKSYHTLGLQSPETASWRWIYASLVRGMDFLCSRPEVDTSRIAVNGSSQGGGLSMVLSGLDHRMQAVFPQYPGLPRLDWTVKYETGYWPFKMSAKPEGQSEEQFLHTLSYFDAANFTPDIQCPTVILAGLLDWVTASGNLINAATHLKPGQVQLICDPWGGHGSGALEFRDRQQETINRFLKQKQFPIVTPSK